MRILMVAQFFPPTIGGEEQHVRTLSRALAARGHDVAVATLSQRGLPDREDDGPVRVHRLQSTLGRASFLYADRARHHAPPFPDPEVLFGLHRIVQEERPDIVHGHNWLIHSYLPLARQRGPRLVVTLHDYSLACAQKRMWQAGRPCSGPGVGKCLRCSSRQYGIGKGVVTAAGTWVFGRVLSRAAAAVVTVSGATAHGNGLSSRDVPFTVIPNFLPASTDEAAEPPGAHKYLPDEPFLLFVGDVVPDKGVGTLLAAYERLDQAPPLVLLGRHTAQTPATTHPNVWMPGAVPHAAVAGAWRRSLFGLMPSNVLESFGIAALEAMSEGRPVIASRIGGIPEFVLDGETGLLVPPGDVGALVNAMKRLLQDPDLRERLGRTARERASAFRAAAVVPRIEALYREVLHAPSSSEVRTDNGEVR